MAHVSDLPYEIIYDVTNRLRSTLKLAPANCFISDHPDDAPPTPSNVWIVVSPDPGGSFVESHIVGGGQDHCTVETQVVTTIHAANQQDQAGHAKEFFGDRNEGVYVLAKNVLKVLTGYMPGEYADTPIQRLHQPLIPTQYTTQRQRPAGSIQIAFKVVFDWDLS